MFSRVVTIVAVVMLALALVGGSAYILLNRANGEQARPAHAEMSGAGYRGGQGELQSAGNRAGAGYRGGQGELQGTGNRAGAGQTGGSRGRFAAPSTSLSSRGRGSGAASEGADHPLETWVTVSGTVVTLDGGDLTVQTSEGQLTVNLGPEWYVEGTGFAPQVGDAVEISGFEEDGTFQVARIVNLTSGETLQLRDETGRPLWAGQGRGSG